MSDPFRFEGGMRWNGALYSDPPPTMFALARRILEVGGDEVVWQEIDPYLLELISERFESWQGEGLFRRGMPSQCHLNSAFFFSENAASGWGLCTGWALSSDGLWRTHSWNLDPHGVPVESTESRLMYVGARLSDLEAAVFVLSEHPLLMSRLTESDPVRWVPVSTELLRAPKPKSQDASVWELLRLIDKAS